MKVAVISDLHLGCGDRADSFRHDEDDFLRFLRFLEDNFERIVLLGDIWETLTGRAFGSPEDELRRARDSHRRLAARFEGPRYQYVHGNHDLVASTALGAPDSLSFEADGVRLLFTHGHHHDALLNRGRWLAEAMIWLGGWLRRLRMSRLYQVGFQLEQLRAGASLDADRCPFQRWAVEIARVEAADVVVTGHTHLATRADHGDRLYLNSGSCSEGAYSFLAIDPRAGRYSVETSW